MKPRSLLLVLLATVTATAAPEMELYDFEPRQAGQDMRLVLKLINPDAQDYYVCSEGIDDIPIMVRFQRNGESFDLSSHDCGTGSRPIRLRAQSYALIEVRILHDIFVSVPTKVRAIVYHDAGCSQALETNEVSLAPEYFDGEEPNQPVTEPTADAAAPHD